jgi:hypothetical protein
VVPPDDPGLHTFLLAALLAPSSLGVPSSEDDAGRALASQAKVPLLAACCCLKGLSAVVPVLSATVALPCTSLPVQHEPHIQAGVPRS